MSAEIETVEHHAKAMAEAAGWHWWSLGETGRLGRRGWREKARAEFRADASERGAS